ncbi:MAG: Asp23/Gls24 family envelope stress response protein [Lachnospiraceae bacterium]|nr:Asp23/Gls24 family envelope stress response protein [Lachnospiraceae bacterium]MDY5741523.1 Asp23/Gls24 family envelope stress response protein [Lachnospiraceae bacterium]
MGSEYSNELGQVTINTEVIAKYAGSVAVECFGIVGMAGTRMTDGLVQLLKREYLSKGIRVSMTDEGKVSLAFHVIVSYGVNIATVADNLSSNVRYKLKQFMGLEVDQVRIHVEGVRVID